MVRPFGWCDAVSLRAVWERLVLMVALMALGVGIAILLTDVSPRRRPMSRRDVVGHRSYAPCSDDCAEESFSNRVQLPSKRERRYPMWVRAIILFLALALAAAFGGTFWPVFTNACEAQQTPRADSTALVIFLNNYTEDTVVVRLTLGPMAPYDSLGFVPPHEHRWFPIPTVELRQAAAVRVAFTWGVQPKAKMELTPVVLRWPDRVTSIVWYVGDLPKPTGMRA